MRYFQEVIKLITKKEDEHENQKNKSHTGLVKVSSLRNTQSSQINPRLVWIMFHKISVVYRDLKHQEALQASLEIQNLKSPASFSPPQIYQPTEPSIAVELQVVPPDLQDIHPRLLQLWNFEEIGFDTNGTWKKMVCTYKFFTGDRIWRTQTGEKAPFWCTSPIFNRADGKISPPLWWCTNEPTTLKISITTYPVIG